MIHPTSKSNCLDINYIVHASNDDSRLWARSTVQPQLAGAGSSQCPRLVSVVLLRPTLLISLRKSHGCGTTVCPGRQRHSAARVRLVLGRICHESIDRIQFLRRLGATTCWRSHRTRGVAAGVHGGSSLASHSKKLALGAEMLHSL